MLVRRCFIVLALVAVVFHTVGPAWACVPIPQALTSLTPRSSGPPGSEVTVNGLGYDEGPIEVRWNGVGGQRLASATGPDFSVLVTIPDAVEGLYGIVVVSRARDGSIGSAGSAAFQVVSPEDPGAGASAPAPSGKDDRAPPTTTSPLTVPLAMAAGASLVALGGLGGAALAGRRRRREATASQES